MTAQTPEPTPEATQEYLRMLDANRAKMAAGTFTKADRDALNKFMLDNGLIDNTPMPEDDTDAGQAAGQPTT